MSKIVKNGRIYVENSRNWSNLCRIRPIFHVIKFDKKRGGGIIPRPLEIKKNFCSQFFFVIFCLKTIF